MANGATIADEEPDEPDTCCVGMKAEAWFQAVADLRSGRTIPGITLLILGGGEPALGLVGPDGQVGAVLRRPPVN
jgi:hypothetical protein